MKKWQENRNYRRIKDENGNIITIDGEDIAVTDEVFLAYPQVDRWERYISEEVGPGKLLSLEKLQADGVLLETLGVELGGSAENMVLEQELLAETEQQKILLSTALAALEEDERLLIEELFFEKVSTRAYASRIGVTQRAVIKRRDRILRDMKKYFEESEK